MKDNKIDFDYDYDYGFIRKLCDNIVIQETFDGTKIKRITPISNEQIVDKVNEIIDVLNALLERR